MYSKLGEQWKRTVSKLEFITGVQRWLDMKGGKAIERSVVMHRTLSEQEARKIAPNSTAKGNVYAFRYRSKFPKGVFFEDVYVNTDSDGVMRVGGHMPQPAE